MPPKTRIDPSDMRLRLAGITIPIRTGLLEEPCNERGLHLFTELVQLGAEPKAPSNFLSVGSKAKVKTKVETFYPAEALLLCFEQRLWEPLKHIWKFYEVSPKRLAAILRERTGLRGLRLINQLLSAPEELQGLDSRPSLLANVRYQPILEAAEKGDTDPQNVDSEEKLANVMSAPTEEEIPIASTVTPQRVVETHERDSK